MWEVIKKMFWIKSRNAKELERLSVIVDQINEFEKSICKYDDSKFLEETLRFKQEIQDYIKPFEDEINSVKKDLKNSNDDDERHSFNIVIKEKELNLYKAMKEITQTLLPEAFALVREAADRRLGAFKIFDLPASEIEKFDSPIRESFEKYSQEIGKGTPVWEINLPLSFYETIKKMERPEFRYRPFDVQLMGGISLHEGKIAEMKTGEGKTVAATLPVYLNALISRGVHIVTVNNYLARRDAEWMGSVYRFMGLTVDCVDNYESGSAERRAAYWADITYGTNNEFGFDYLRDNMAIFADECVQRPHFYAIVDEVDSILVDEARTPLIISGLPEKSSMLYSRFSAIAKSPQLIRETHYVVDEKAHSVTLTEEGTSQIEKMLGIENLYGGANLEYTHFLNAALKAQHLFKKDVDYVVKDKKVMIVDEFTGRLMPDRRYSQGLHQALEAKEGLRIEHETQTLATITLQNYFRMYKKLAGMTGTAKTEEKEFAHIYGLKVVEIPPNRPIIREDLSDLIYKSVQEKYEAVVEDIKELNAKGQPVLVGTISIEASELLGQMLKNKGLACNVLNAKYHELEAKIIAEAGEYGQITIATNMAGRGTDIKLDDKAKAAGGLCIIGTERHESRRIDNQLRGRSGRQGDPGASRFYISLEDDLMRLFGSDRIKGVMETLGLPYGEAIEHKFISSAIERAQKKVEERNFGIRKQVLEYDDIMNQQRIAIYEQRQRVLNRENLRNSILGMGEDIITEAIEMYLPAERDSIDWDFESLLNRVNTFFPVNATEDSFKDMTKPDEVQELIISKMKAAYNEREAKVDPELMRKTEQIIVLRVVDNRWKEHLSNMDVLQEGIWTRAYGQKDPLVEYKFEALRCYQEMIQQIREEVVNYIFKIEFDSMHEEQQEVENRTEYFTNKGEDDSVKKEPVRRKIPKIKPNSPCPCGSGKKYKKCCGLGKV